MGQFLWGIQDPYQPWLLFDNRGDEKERLVVCGCFGGWVS